MADDDDDGFMGFMFDDEDDDDDDAGEPNVEDKQQQVALVKDPTCPLDDPTGARVKVMYEGEANPAILKSYQEDSNTYTICWMPLEVLQFRTKPEDIVWEAFDDSVLKKEEEKVEEDELWLAARRGDLEAVKEFVEVKGVPMNETGVSQQRTPFYHAVFCGHVALVEYFLARGATDDDNTAFIAANAEIREILQQHKSNPAKVHRKSTEQGRRASVTKQATERVKGMDVSEEEREKLIREEEAKINQEALEKTQARRASHAAAETAAEINRQRRALSQKRVTFAPEKKSKTKALTEMVKTRRGKLRNAFVQFMVRILPARG